MAYTTDRTWVTGEIATAAFFNTYLRDNMKWLSTDAPYCRVYNSAVQAIATATVTALTYDTETSDNASMHSTSSLTSRITIPSGAGGFYLISGAHQFDANATGYRSSYLRANGATQITPQWDFLPAAQNGNFSNMQHSTAYPLAAAGYVEYVVYQTSGGNLNSIVGSGYQPHFWAMWQRI